MPEREIAISDPTKRSVRQRCGFGCVLCGLPIYQYDHMRGYTLENADDPDEITLLCPNHHDDKTRRRLPLDRVLRANAQPVNIAAGISSPYGLNYYGRECAICFGGDNVFVGAGQDVTALLMRDEEVIAFHFTDSAQMMLNVRIRQYSGQMALQIVENEMVYSSQLWDIEYVGQTLTVRQGSGKILFVLVFTPPSRIELTKADLQYAEVSVTVDAEGFHVRGPGGRERDVSGYRTAGVRYAISLDCTRWVGAVGLAL